MSPRCPPRQPCVIAVSLQTSTWNYTKSKATQHFLFIIENLRALFLHPFDRYVAFCDVEYQRKRRIKVSNSHIREFIRLSEETKSTENEFAGERGVFTWRTEHRALSWQQLPASALRTQTEIHLLLRLRVECVR